MTTLRGLMAAALMAGGLAGGAMAQSADGMDRTVSVVNGTSQTMTRFYASNVGTNDWQEDLFGDEVLAAGQSVDISVDDGTGYCRYDFKAVFEDGTELIDARVNVCGGESAEYVDG